MELLTELWNWVWARHANPLSWYIRPFFLIPLAYFCYRRSGWSVALTFVGLATSMFWFPAPASPDPQFVEFLRIEQEFLLNPTVGRVLVSLLVPLCMTAFCLVFWRRSLLWGAVLVNLIAVIKFSWSVVVGGESGWSILLPMVVGLAACDLLLYFGARWIRQHRNGLSHA